MLVVERIAVITLIKLLGKSGKMVLVSPKRGSHFRADISVEDDSRVCLTAPTWVDPGQIKEGEFITIEFEVSDKVMYFTVPLTRAMISVDQKHLVLTTPLPTEILDNDRRQNTRVTLAPIIPLKVRINLFGQDYRCAVYDVSHAGLKISRPATEFADSLVMTRALVAASLHDIEFSGVGELRWGNASAAGVFLPDMEAIDPRDLSHPWVKIVQRCATLMMSIELRQMAIAAVV